MSDTSVEEPESGAQAPPPKPGVGMIQTKPCRAMHIPCPQQKCGVPPRWPPLPDTVPRPPKTCFKSGELGNLCCTPKNNSCMSSDSGSSCPPPKYPLPCPPPSPPCSPCKPCCPSPPCSPCKPCCPSPSCSPCKPCCKVPECSPPCCPCPSCPPVCCPPPKVPLCCFPAPTITAPLCFPPSCCSPACPPNCCPSPCCPPRPCPPCCSPSACGPCCPPTCNPSCCSLPCCQSPPYPSCCPTRACPCVPPPTLKMCASPIAPPIYPFTCYPPSCCPADPEIERPRNYEEVISGDSSWSKRGLRIAFTDPPVPGDSVLVPFRPLFLTLTLEAKEAEEIQPECLGAYCWTHIITADNPCGVWKDLRMSYDPWASDPCAKDVQKFVFRGSITPVCCNNCRLTFNVKYGDVMVWANDWQIDNLVMPPDCDDCC